MERGITADQVLAALWRRKFLVFAVVASAAMLGAAVVFSLPAVYQATAIVRVEPQRPQAELVNRTVSEGIEDRLLTVRAELLSSPVLSRAIGELNLYPDIVSKKGVETAVDQMRKDLEVKMEGTNAYDVTYSARSAQVAAKVANRLPEIFAEETVKSRQAQAARATALFNDEMKSLQSAVVDWERKIAQFKVDHLGELPEQIETNMRGLERVSTQLNTKSEELRAVEGRRSDLARAHYNQDTEAGKLEAQETTLLGQLTDARSQYTEDHPDVQRLSKDLGTIRHLKKGAEDRMSAERQERARAAELERSIQSDTEALHQQAAAFQKRLDHTPRWANELAIMQADYDQVKTKYQSVVSRKVESEIAQEMEMRSAKSLFNVVSPATVLDRPAKPDRMSAMAIVLLLSLALGVLVGVVLETRDESVRDTSEIKGRLPIPVLAIVPNLTGKTDRRVLTPARASSLN